MKTYSVNKAKVMLTGYAQGGFLTFALGMVYSDLFCGLLPVGGAMPDNISVEKMKNKSVKIYALVGTRVNAQTVEANEMAEKKFKRYGVPFKLKKIDHGGHSYPDNKMEILSEALSWFL